MPAYISHAIMGEELHQKLENETKLFKIPISKDALKGYSLGVDLAILSKKTISDPHNYHTREFFLRMIKYIKEKNYIENANIMSLLYGHIGHYFLDINTHPLIYYIESKCKKEGLIASHDLIEGYLSAYLSRKILGKDIMEIKPSYFNKINLSNQEESQLLNLIYGDIYGDYEIIKTYQKTMNILTFLETIIKSGFVTKEQLIKISNFIKFLDKNNITTSDITNENHNVYINLSTEEEHTESFIDLYQKSITDSLEAITTVNEYLYSNESLDSINKVFRDLSYETGIPCSKEKIYVHKKKR